MSNTFNYTRFIRLFRKHTAENYRSYIMSAFVLCGIIVLFYSFMFFVSENKIPFGNRIGSLIWFYLLGGTVFTSTIFAEYGSREKSVAALMLPASQYEKFFTGWLYSFLIFTGVFFICFYAIDMVFVYASRASQEDKMVLNLFAGDEKLYYVFFFYAVLHAFILYGAIFFKKLHFIKTTCVFLVLLVIVLGMHTQLMKFLIPNEIFPSGMPLDRFSFGDYKNQSTISIDKEVDTFYKLFLVTGLSITLWAAAYFRLKEKQT